MSSDLEKQIKGLKNEFDFAEPNVGHFERFQAKLNHQEKPKTKQKWVYWSMMSAAASVLLLIGFALGNQQSTNDIDLADVSPEMAETQAFYTLSIQKELEEINKRKTENNSKIIEDAFKQLNKLENNYLELKQRLKESNEDNRVVYAMISNFQKRVEVLQNLLDQLERIEALSNNTKQIV